MIIVHMTGGLGNQLFQYAAGRQLAHKWNTELKIDKSYYDDNKAIPYVLNMFNVKDPSATPEEILRIKNLVPNNKLGREQNSTIFNEAFFNYPDDVYLDGYWESEKYFADVADIVREEFTLRQPLGSAAEYWQEKILATENSVSLHFRHGDVIYSPQWSRNVFLTPLQLDYYHECINRLRRQYKNITLFVFSNNLQWVKENLRADVPTEFVEGTDLRDFEELYLMSLCKHNVIANSTFSWWGAWLNRNPDKKVFVPMPSVLFGTNKHYRHFFAERNENSPLQTERWIRIPFDANDKPAVTIRTYFSLLLVVNDDIATINESLNSIIGQDYRFFELIIVDNASTDGSGKICRQAAQNFDNVTLIKLWKKIPNDAAWDKAFDIAQGEFVLFLTGKDRLLVNALSLMYLVNGTAHTDVVNSVRWLREDDGGDIPIGDKKFVMQSDAAFRDAPNTVRGKFDNFTLLKFLANNDVPPPIGTRIFKRKFLAENRLRFGSSDSEILFVVNAMLQADENIFTQNPFYVAPPNRLQTK